VARVPAAEIDVQLCSKLPGIILSQGEIRKRTGGAAL
jgi:hypothetical protein